MPSEIKTYRSERLQESCYVIDHTSGLKIYVLPKPDYRSGYAIFATRYGSIDNAFLQKGKSEPTVVPAGIAHYLEHKLFENEDCDAFERYARTGADANAYTSFDRTGYLFSCSGDMVASLEILLDFVQKPYFTEQTVQKEQGIIAQEIQMGEDSPHRKVLHNLMEGLYEAHPVRIEIAGTVASIAQITPELLYDCYRTFYNLNNMVLAVAGNITPQEVLAVADRLLIPADPFETRRAYIPEPRAAKTPRVEAVMPVAAPLFYLGFKQPFTEEDGTRCLTATESAAASVIMELLIGRASPLYDRLMKEGLINNSFFGDTIDGAGFMTWIFGGESADPDAVAQAIHEEIAALRQNGMDERRFAAAKRSLYGELVASLNTVENGGDLLADDFLYGREPFALAEAAAALTAEEVTAFLAKGLYPDMATLSVIHA